MMPLPRLLVFCGIPGSGKTTVANLVAAELQDVVHVQTDVVRSMIPGRNYANDESEFVYSACITLASEALMRGYDVILDGTFLREEYRREALRRLRGACDSHLVVFVHCDAMTAYQRNSSRGANVPQERFNLMLLRLQEPANSLNVDTGKLSPEEAAKAVLLRLKNG
jgi:hypothetical protein